MPTRRSSKRQPAGTPSGDAAVLGGWLPSLTLALGVMDVYESVDDEIQRFRDFRLPWVYVCRPERLFDGWRVRPIAFNHAERLVLLHILDNSAPWMVLSQFRSDSVDGPYGKFKGSYENMGHFVHANA